MRRRGRPGGGRRGLWGGLQRLRVGWLCGQRQGVERRDAGQGVQQRAVRQQGRVRHEGQVRGRRDALDCQVGRRDVRNEGDDEVGGIRQAARRHGRGHVDAEGRLALEVRVARVVLGLDGHGHLLDDGAAARLQPRLGDGHHHLLRRGVGRRPGAAVHVGGHGPVGVLHSRDVESRRRAVRRAPGGRLYAKGGRLPRVVQDLHLAAEHLQGVGSHGAPGQLLERAQGGGHGRGRRREAAGRGAGRLGARRLGAGRLGARLHVSARVQAPLLGGRVSVVVTLYQGSVAEQRPRGRLRGHHGGVPARAAGVPDRGLHGPLHGAHTRRAELLERPSGPLGGAAHRRGS